MNRDNYLYWKRLLDILFGIAGLIFLIPISIVVKVCSMLGGNLGSIFYRQTRIGQYGRPIKIWKFRSMVKNSEEILEEMLKDEVYRKEWEENQKFEHDPRITKIGKVLRMTSLDEFPQFINVLKGDMSLVGPRPLVEGELEAHGGKAIYNDVKPGITGWWACNGRSNMDYQARLELEYYYVEHCSLTMDIKCISKTILAVLFEKGAK